MTVLAVGPRTGNPSWEWVGLGPAGALRGSFTVVLFDDLEELPAADIVLIVKQRPAARVVEAIRAGGGRPFFVPIDVYQQQAEIVDDAPMLALCDAVLVHAAALGLALAPFCRRVAAVEHHARFALDAPAGFRADGFLLWIGAIQHVPHLLHFLERHPPPIEVRLLTDLDSRSGRIAAHVEAYRLGLRLRVGDGEINGRPTERWSEAAQSALMRRCRAAIDIKGDSFNQRTKPPTKAQQFVASGIPFGCNPGHPAAGYFAAHGFAIADAADFRRLLSHDYWAATQGHAPSLRARTALPAVADAYRRILTAPPCGC